MNNKLSHVAAFLAGAASGGAVVWRLVKIKYERIAEEEISSVKETYSRREAVVVKTIEDVPAAVSEPPQRPNEGVLDYAARLRKEGYLPGEDSAKKEEMSMSAEAPYIIEPEEFGECDGYETISLTYYADGTLTDENDEIVEDAEEIVGSDFHNHFGEYEDDSVFIRNDKLRCDYEILLDQRPYSEVIKAKPYLHREE